MSSVVVKDVPQAQLYLLKGCRFKEILMRYREIKKESAEQLSKYKKYKAIYDSHANKNGPIARFCLSRMSEAQSRLKELRSK
jgi:hypothetical protein